MAPLWAVYEAQQYGKVEVARQDLRNDPFLNLAPISLERFFVWSDDFEDEEEKLMLSVKRVQVDLFMDVYASFFSLPPPSLQVLAL